MVEGPIEVALNDTNSGAHADESRILTMAVADTTIGLQKREYSDSLRWAFGGQIPVTSLMPAAILDSTYPGTCPAG